MSNSGTENICSPLRPASDVSLVFACHDIHLTEQASRSNNQIELVLSNSGTGTFAMAPQGSSLRGELWRNNHTPNEIAWSIRAWSHPATVPPSLWIGFRAGVQVGDATCLPSIVPRVLTAVLTSHFLTSHLKQIVFLTRSWSRVLVSGTSFNCFPSLSGRGCLRPAPSHPLSPGIPNLLAAANRHRCRTIERHHSPPTSVSHR